MTLDETLAALKDSIRAYEETGTGGAGGGQQFDDRLAALGAVYALVRQAEKLLSLVPEIN